MRILGGVLAALIVLIQYPLWLGKGGWLRVWEVDRQLESQRARNLELQVRNRSLEAEVLDLKQGVDALEERARYELGMIKSDEVFFQIVDGNKEAGK
ncbi:MAG TPA: cell division protein FtsB [Burkholderiales bacterium]